MWIALLAAIGSVALGASIALFPGVRGDALGRVRTFALIAAITVVAGHLLPEAAGELGPIALVLVLLGVVLPTWVEDLVEKLVGGAHEHGDHHDHHRSSLGLEIGYAGLLLHHVGDGVALYQYGASPHASHDVVLALAAHTLPVTAVVVVQYLSTSGRRAALWRAAGLAIATLVGIAIGALFPVVLDQFAPWIAALVSGLLLHVIAHDLEADPPRTVSARAIDLLAAAAGVALPVIANPEYDAGFTRAFLGVLASAALPLLAGLVIVAAIDLRIIARSARETFSYASMMPAVRFAASVAFASPVLRPEVIALAWWFLGWERLLLLLAAPAMIVIVGSPMIVALAAKPFEPAPRVEARGFLDRLSASFAHTAPWMVAGAFAAVYARAGLTGPFTWALGAAVLLVAAPTYLAAAGLIPVAAALLEKGAPWGPILACLVIGPVLHLKMIGFFARRFGARAAIAALIAVVAVAGFCAYAAGDRAASLPAALDAGIASDVALGLLGLLLVRSVWTIGVRSLIASMKLD